MGDDMKTVYAYICLTYPRNSCTLRCVSTDLKKVEDVANMDARQLEREGAVLEYVTDDAPLSMNGKETSYHYKGAYYNTVLKIVKTNLA